MCLRQRPRNASNKSSDNEDDNELSWRSLPKLTNCWLSYSSRFRLYISASLALSLSSLFFLLSHFLFLNLYLYLYRPLFLRSNSIGKVISSNSLSNTTNQLAPLSLSHSLNPGRRREKGLERERGEREINWRDSRGISSVQSFFALVSLLPKSFVTDLPSHSYEFLVVRIAYVTRHRAITHEHRAFVVNLFAPGDLQLHHVLRSSTAAPS